MNKWGRHYHYSHVIIRLRRLSNLRIVVSAFSISLSAVASHAKDTALNRDNSINGQNSTDVEKQNRERIILT